MKKKEPAAPFYVIKLIFINRTPAMRTQSVKYESSFVQNFRTDAFIPSGLLFK